MNITGNTPGYQGLPEEWKAPCNNEVNEALKNAEVPDGDSKILQQYYEKWAETYDSNMHNLQYRTHAVIAEEASKLADEKDKKNWTIFDLGVGTGLVGVELRNQGFQGQITGLDYSSEMLKKTMSRPGVYHKGIRHACTVTNPIPVEDESFDLLVCGGGFGPDSIKPNCFPDALRIVRKGGYIIMGLRVSKKTSEVVASIKEQSDALEKEGKIKPLKYYRYEQYKWEIENGNRVGPEDEILFGNLFTFQKHF